MTKENDNKIYIGEVISPKVAQELIKHSVLNFDTDDLSNTIICGGEFSGKTTTAMSFISNLKDERKNTRFIIFDDKDKWRNLADYVPEGHFNFYSLGDPDFKPLKLNPWKVPYGIDPEIWMNGVVNIYCSTYGLLEKSREIIADTVYELYDYVKVFDMWKKDKWKSRIPELSKNITFVDIYLNIKRKKMELEKIENKDEDIKNKIRGYERILDRLSYFCHSYSPEYQLYGTEKGKGIDELIKETNDDVMVLERRGLEWTFCRFIFAFITYGVYQYSLLFENGFLSEKQYETVLVIERADEILTKSYPDDSDIFASKETELEKIFKEEHNNGLYVFAITQKISDIPSYFINNCKCIFAGRCARPSDIKTVIKKIDCRENELIYKKIFPELPRGYFICKIKENQPHIICRIDFGYERISDEELAILLVNYPPLKIRDF